MILDIHSHKPSPYPEGVISLNDAATVLSKGQCYSAGVHPWDTNDTLPATQLDRLAALASDPQIVAIGECGVDLLKGGPLFRQLQVFKFQIELSERLRKPLIIHCVKGADIILGLKRDFNPVQPWIIHGFRGKPSLARQLTSRGIYLSFGEKFNAETLLEMPPGLILAETDDSILTITEIIGQLSQSANRDLTPDIIANTSNVLATTDPEK